MLKIEIRNGGLLILPWSRYLRSHVTVISHRAVPVCSTESKRQPDSHKHMEVALQIFLVMHAIFQLILPIQSICIASIDLRKIYPNFCERSGITSKTPQP